MKKKLKNFTGLWLLVMVCGFSAISASAVTPSESMLTGDQDFVLYNNTNVEIYALYVTPHNADDWGDDILGVDTLPPGESVEITFSRKEKAKYWDLRVEDEEGNFIEWGSLNLMKISTVKLYYKNGKASAVVQ
jgi:hypothetical protein